MREFNLDSMVLGPDGAVKASLRCCKCRYLLKNRRPEETCPECGTLVQESITNRFQAPAWARFAVKYWFIFLKISLITGTAIWVYALITNTDFNAWRAMLTQGHANPSTTALPGVVSLIICLGLGMIFSFFATISVWVCHVIYEHLVRNAQDKEASENPRK